MDYLEQAKRAIEEYRRAKIYRGGEDSEAREAVLKGRVVELYLVEGERLLIVANEEDARRLGQPRGSIYTANEAQRVVQIGDPTVVAEVHRWKRQINATVSECRKK